MKLYEIVKEYEEILMDLYDDEGEVNPQALMRLEENKGTVEKKAIAVASFIKNLDAEREAIDNAKKAMAKREKQYKRKIDELEGYLLTNMERRGITSVKCPHFEIKLKKCPLSVDDDKLNMDILPDEYKRIETYPDKIKMLREMKEGVVIPGAAMKQNLKLDIK